MFHRGVSYNGLRFFTLVLTSHFTNDYYYLLLITKVTQVLDLVL